MKPIIKSAGGKRWLTPRIKEIYERFDNPRLVEPFVGGMAVTLEVLPERALLNDICLPIINLYHWVQKGLVEFDYGLFIYEEDHYYRCRNFFNQISRFSSTAAQLFYYLNKSGFNGLTRFNSKGEFNVPFGRHKHVNYEIDLNPYFLALQNWGLSWGDFETIVLNPDDFLYVDPPYDDGFTQYAIEAFSWDDQVRLVNWLVNHPGPIVASNRATPRIQELYKENGFEVELIDGPRSISCNGDRTPVKEILATRNL